MKAEVAGGRSGAEGITKRGIKRKMSCSKRDRTKMRQELGDLHRSFACWYKGKGGGGRGRWRESMDLL